LHGAFCDSRDWRRQLDAFAAEFTVIAWDAPGCGESADLPSPGYGLDNLIGTLAGFIRALHLQRPHVLGLSLGSVLAIALHARYPMSAWSLVLASAYAGWAGSLPLAEVQRRIRFTLRDLNRPAADVAREFVATLLPATAPQRQVDEQIEMITQARPATTRAMLTHIAPVDLRPLLSRIDVPTLLLYGGADGRAPTAVADALHAQIPGSLLVQLAGVGHCGHVQAPEQWNRAVPRFPACSTVTRHSVRPRVSGNSTVIATPTCQPTQCPIPVHADRQPVPR
jgi:pimeloyl-ACP methyl ester carboxylesterase